MDTLLKLLAGMAIGTYYAETIRENVTILDPNKGPTLPPAER